MKGNISNKNEVRVPNKNPVETTASEGNKQSMAIFLIECSRALIISSAFTTTPTINWCPRNIGIKNNRVA